MLLSSEQWREIPPQESVCEYVLSAVYEIATDNVPTFTGHGNKRNNTNTSDRPFFGNLPSTLSRRVMHMIATNPYSLREKTDGERALLVRFANGVFFVIFRSWSLYIPHYFLSNTSGGARTGAFPSTASLGCVTDVFDGEVVREIPTDNPEVDGIVSFLVFDALVVDNQQIAMCPFRERIDLAATRLDKDGPFWPAENEDLVSCSWGTSLSADGLYVRVKQGFVGEQVEELFQRITCVDKGSFGEIDPATGFARLPELEYNDPIANTTHFTDGVVFNPENIPYVFFHVQDVTLKWKPIGLNTVDLALLGDTSNASMTNANDAADHAGQISLAYMTRGALQRERDQWTLAYEIQEFLPERLWSVIECIYDPKRGEWVPIKLRKDKETPNYAQTLIQVLQSQVDNITSEEIIQACTQWAKNEVQ